MGPTPILDRLVPPPPIQAAKRSKARTILLIVVAGLAFGITLIALSPDSPFNWFFSNGPAQPIVNFIGRTIGQNTTDPPGWTLVVQRVFYPWLALMAMIVVHECGHAVMGVLAGFRLMSIHFGRLQITPPFRLKWNRKQRFPGASGFAIMTPIHTRNLRYRALAMIAAGPLANLVSLIIAFFLPQAGPFCGWFVIFSLIGVANLIPFRSRVVLSDGKRILMLLRNSQQGERWLALMALGYDLRRGVEPEDLRPDLLALATAVKDNSPDTASGYVLAYTAAIYKKDPDEAARLLEICFEYSGFVPPVMREALFADAAGFQAKWRKRVDLARQWLADIPEKPQMPELRLGVESAILAAEGDIPGALKKLDESEALIQKFAEPYRKDLSLRFLRRKRKELEEKRAATA